MPRTRSEQAPSDHEHARAGVEERALRVVPRPAAAGQALTHKHILREVWGSNSVEQTHYRQVYQAHLREKLEVDPASPKHFITESDVGYRLVE